MAKDTLERYFMVIQYIVLGSSLRSNLPYLITNILTVPLRLIKGQISPQDVIYGGSRCHSWTLRFRRLIPKIPQLTLFNAKTSTPICQKLLLFSILSLRGQLYPLGGHNEIIFYRFLKSSFRDLSLVSSLNHVQGHIMNQPCC